MTSEQLIQALARRLGLENLEPEEPGRWRIVFDGDLAVDLRTLGPKTVRFEATIGKPPEDEYQQEQFLRFALARNLSLLGEGVARNVLFLDPDRAILSIHKAVNAEDFDEETFAESAEDFVNASEAWLEFAAVEADPTPPGLAMRL